ncbi:MAG: hypothetical protein WCT05_07810 [Lentisphaeria bacterium]
MVIFGRKGKYLILFVLLLILLFCFAITTYYLVTRSYQEVEYYQKALQTYEQGETAKAKELMQQVIRNDWNNELAITTLANWFDQEEEWNYAAWLWLRATNLNAFKPEYLQNARLDFFRSRAFRETYNSFEQKKIPISESETLQYTYAALSIGKNSQAEELFASLTNPEIRNSPLGRLISIYLPHDKEKTKEQTAQELSALLDCGDKFIVFECLLDLHSLELTHFKRPEAGLARLQEAAALNPVNGIPILGDYYFAAQQYENAAETYQKNPENGFWSLSLLRRYAEALTLINRPEELAKLSKRCQTGDKNLLLCGYYLDALQALLGKDLEKLLFSYEKTGNRFQSPMAKLLNLLVQIQKKNHFEIENLARFFISNPSLIDFRARADQALFPHLINLLQDNQLANAAALARIMLKDRKPELLLTRIDIADKAQENLLDAAEINKALRFFPEDEFLLQRSIEFNLQKKNYQSALQDALKLEIKQADSPDPSMLSILALTGLEKFSEADAKYVALSQKFPENRQLLDNFLNYCSTHKRRDSLLKLITMLEQSENPEIREYLPVLKAMAAFWQNQYAQVEKLLGGLQTQNPELLYHAAFMLASMDRLQPAIKFYQQIGKEHPKYFYAQLNLSELLAITGEKAQALAIAKTVWESAPNWPATRECYGLRLLENGKAGEAADTLDALMLDKSSTLRARKNWRAAMQKMLETQFAAAEYGAAQKTCRRLLLYFENDSIATSYSPRIQQALLEQGKKEQEAAKQKP